MIPVSGDEATIGGLSYFPLTHNCSPGPLADPLPPRDVQRLAGAISFLGCGGDEAE
jgi:hypothetical protein